jgi:Cu+-exporting ATPase
MSPAELVFMVEGMHCASCGLLIDDVVEELPGVSASRTDVPRARTVVSLTEPLTAGRHEIVDRILAAIADAGYPARPIG